MITRSNLLAAIIAAVGLVAVGAAGGYWWSHRSAESADAAPMGGRKVLYWHDPMVPNAKFDKPGKSPYMNMDLVPVYADEAGDAGAGVRVSPAVRQNLGVRLGKVERGSLSRELSAVGEVAFDERLLELVQARVDGVITRLHVKAPLERVRRGQPLADIQAPAWLEAQQEYLALLDAQSDRTQAIRDAARTRLQILGVPEAMIRQIESERRTRTTTTIVAPIDGVVSELSVREGAAFEAGAALFRINGLESVWVNAQIPEAQVARLPQRSKVTALATAWPGMRFKGEILALVPEVAAQTRTLTARVSLRNWDRKLSPGMYVSLDFEAPSPEPQLLIPSEAVIATGERTVVVTVGEGGAFEVADVRLGAEQGGRTVILSGLKEGQSIVLSGQFLIDSEASLRSAVNRLESSGPEGEDAGHSTDATAAVHLSQGRITVLTPEEVTIAHEPVPSLKWRAMTMTFKAPETGMPRDLAVGQAVTFSFTAHADGHFQIERIAPLARKQTEGTP
jgi:Cu(I)/Ag(I) efflux system membrane fusion protein